MTRQGARSILGSLPAYAKTAALAFVVTAVVMTVWLTGDRFGDESAAPAARVSLPAASSWSEVTLDDGRALRVVTPGETLELAPGAYRVLGLADDADARADVDLAPGDLVDLDALLSRDARAR